MNHAIAKSAGWGLDLRLQNGLWRHTAALKGLMLLPKGGGVFDLLAHCFQLTGPTHRKIMMWLRDLIAKFVIVDGVTSALTSDPLSLYLCQFE